MNRHVLLLDWGDARGRADLSVSGHIEQLLLPLLREVGEPAALIGYCLGGTMAIAAANLAPVERVVTLATPWNFAAYPAAGREEPARHVGPRPRLRLTRSAPCRWRCSRPPSGRWIPSAPCRNSPNSPPSIRPAPTPAASSSSRIGPTRASRSLAPPAAELMEQFFGADVPGQRRLGDRRHRHHRPARRAGAPFTAAHDRITPAATAPAGDTVEIASGHVGMIVGTSRTKLHAALKALPRPRLPLSGR